LVPARLIYAGKWLLRCFTGWLFTAVGCTRSCDFSALRGAWCLEDHTAVLIFLQQSPYCPQLTARGSPPCYCCDDPETTSRLEETVRKTKPPTPGFVQWRQTLANWILAMHLPGGRLLFVKTDGVLWTQQPSSGVCYEGIIS